MVKADGAVAYAGGLGGLHCRLDHRLRGSVWPPRRGHRPSLHLAPGVCVEPDVKWSRVQARGNVMPGSASGLGIRVSLPSGSKQTPGSRCKLGKARDEEATQTHVGDGQGESAGRQANLRMRQTGRQTEKGAALWLAACPPRRWLWRHAAPLLLADLWGAMTSRPQILTSTPTLMYTLLLRV